MKKLFILLLFVIIGQVSFGQVYQLMPQYGYEVKRMSFDSTLQIPTICGTPTLKSIYNTKRCAIAFDSCNNRFYTYNPKTATWSYLGSGGGSQNLQQVTDQGAMTTNNISIPKLYYYDSSNLFYSLNTYSLDENFYIHSDFGNYDIAQFLDGGIIIHNSTNNSASTIAAYNINGTKNFLLPDSSGTFALKEYTINSVSQPNDSTLTFQKGATQTSYTIRSSVAGSATRLVTSVYNNSGSIITKGSVVYINGAHSSNLPTIALAKANQESTSAYTYGLVETDIANNASGIVIQSGTITNLNLPTSTYTDGQTLYLSPTTAGGYTTTKPTAPNHYVAIGTITRAHPNFGTIQIAIRNGFQLDEMSDVQIAAVPADSTLLQFSRVDSLWHDVSVVNAIGTKYIKPSDTATMLTNYAKTSAVNLKVNISDTATMLSKYLRKTDTTTLSTRIDARVKYTDTSSMLSPYQRSITAVKYSDTANMLTNYAKTSSVNLKVNIADTANMLTNYAKTSVVNTKLNISDTTAFDRKSSAAFTFRANNTSSTANMTDQVFRDSGTLTYSGTITWTGTTAPSGTTSHRYRWCQIGKQVTLTMSINYATAGSALTALKLTLPVGCPSPTNFGTLTAANDVLGSAWAFLGISTSNATTARVTLNNNASNNGFEFNITAASANYRVAGFTITYFTD